MIYASFRAEGPLEKPDVIGAIFGQTEGLLGSDLEMRELQKEGKIGRIEVELEIVDGKSVGEIQVPSALDKSETTLIAAALETIDRIGPTEAHIEISKIEDVRGTKRDYILERAKRLLHGLDEGGSFKEMSESLKVESRAARLQEYGEEKLPAGDLSGNEIIVVEGRADVVNLLKYRVNNVIGMNGTKLPPEIIELSKEKEITIFVDGDRGGQLIARNVIENAQVAYVAVAPEGKEVEELTGKEILIALRKRVPVSDFLARGNGSMKYAASNNDKNTESSLSSTDAKEKMRELYQRVRETKAALLVDANFDVIQRESAKSIQKALHTSRKKVHALVIDGIATAALIRECNELGVVYLGATNFASVDGTSVTLVSL